jgi:hypothetical protein
MRRWRRANRAVPSGGAAEPHSRGRRRSARHEPCAEAARPRCPGGGARRDPGKLEGAAPEQLSGHPRGAADVAPFLDLSAVRVPVLVMAGTEDRVASLAQMEALAAALPDSRLVRDGVCGYSLDVAAGGWPWHIREHGRNYECPHDGCGAPLLQTRTWSRPGSLRLLCAHAARGNLPARTVITAYMPACLGPSRTRTDIPV